MEFKNGDKYDGEWSEDHMHGKGVLEYTNGDKYDGDFKKDKKDGVGRFLNKLLGEYTYKNKDRYSGEWSNDKKNGYGTSSIKCKAHTSIRMGTSIPGNGKKTRKQSKVYFK
eukprot:TRINITY_DN1103_c0_g6_i1.p1 TRINITY_DN1103_c0_g6~~TRINITY_DN1103_c0_g6_i1.p1  ORF type:complete len:111 (+),score=6.33 TRINITY_DN1103_c0_g6_i1:134-466(+)